MQPTPLATSGVVSMASSPAQRRRRWLLVVFVLLILPVVLAIALVTVALATGVRSVKVFGQAMEPTIPQGSFLLVQRADYQDQYPARGEIVLFNPPSDPSEQYVERVIGLPGEHIQIRGGQVYVNGTRLVEPYSAGAPDYTDDRVVSPGYIYVLGDNRNESSDSHEWGLLPRDNLIDHAIAIYWPLPARGLGTPSYPGLK
jgi:signal peptidase I